MLSCQSVSLTFDHVPVVRDFSCTINPGECVVLTGPAGSGKTALLHLMMGMLRPSSGTVTLDGVDLALLPAPLMQMYRRKSGIVYQDWKLMSDKTVAQNIAFPLEVCGIPTAERIERTDELLTTLGLQKAAGLYPRDLSPELCARTALGRALVAPPMILFVDDPLAQLNEQEAHGMVALLQSLKNDKITMICTARNATLAQRLDARIILMDESRPAETGQKRSAIPKITKEPAKNVASGKKVKITQVGS